MNVLILLPIFFACFFDVSRTAEGPDAKPGEFPWQVAILAQNTKEFCGGSLISKDWVLTAAHCVEEETITVLRFGAVNPKPEDKDMKEIISTYFIYHKLFNDALQNDIALIKLPQPMEFTDKIKSIRLPKYGEIIKPGVEIIVSGWGSSCGIVRANATLNSLVLRTISNEECISYYGPISVRCNTFCAISDNTIGVCTGDSGGPAVVFNEKEEPVLHGIISFGSANISAVGHPSGFIRTEAMLDWISYYTGLSL